VHNFDSCFLRKASQILVCVQKQEESPCQLRQNNLKQKRQNLLPPDKLFLYNINFSQDSAADKDKRKWLVKQLGSKEFGLALK